MRLVCAVVPWSPTRRLPRAGSACGLVLTLCVLASSAPASAAPTRAVRVTIDAQESGARIPGDFLGLSFETLELAAVASFAHHGTLVRLLRSLGPGVIRFGGNSVDFHTAYVPAGQKPPAWARSVVTPQDLQTLASLVRKTGWKVLLGADLAHYDPRRAARLAIDAHRRLASGLVGIELGNEPNGYGYLGVRAPDWRYALYKGEARAYAQAIRAAVPDVSIAGPAVTGIHAHGWVTKLASDVRPELLTVHHYPLSGCSATAPTMDAMLGRQVAQKDRAVIRDLAHIQRKTGIPTRLAETNSVSCRGRDGVSNTLGSGLWGTRYLLRAAHAGLAGVNLHTLPSECDGYSALCASDALDYAAGRLTARPLWYAMLLFSQLRAHRFVRFVARPHLPGVHLAALRDRTGSSAELVAVNSVPGRPVRLQIRRSHADPPKEGTIHLLEGTSLGATTGIRLAGRSVGPRGTWRPRSGRRLRARHGPLEALVPADTAAVIRIPR
jgi:hypothetical protein